MSDSDNRNLGDGSASTVRVHDGDYALMHLGEMPPDISAIQDLHMRRQIYLSNTGRSLQRAERSKLIADYAMLDFKTYRKAVTNADRWRGELRRKGELRDLALTPQLETFLEDVFDEDRHTADQQGWMQYLADISPKMADKIVNLRNPAVFPEAPRAMHTLITAGTGWGKSTLMKTLIHHYVVNPTAAVVVLDPHGDMASQVAHFPEFAGNDRLIYIKPDLRAGYTVGFNPLDGRGLKPEDCAIVAAQLATAIGELTSELSPNMQLLAQHCLRILLEESNCTLRDFRRMLSRHPRRGEKEQREPRILALLEKGKKHRDPEVSDFFKFELDDESLDSARRALRNRISTLLSTPGVSAMTCGRPTINLQTLLEQRKVVVVNLAPFGPEGAAAMGRLILNLVAAIGRRRQPIAEAYRVPCHVFVDEASEMVSPAMGRFLTQLRKFRIHLTLAQQAGGQGFDDEGKRVLVGSTACKLIGSNDRTDLSWLRGKRPDDSTEAKINHFWVEWGHGSAVQLVKVRDDLKDNDHAMPITEWKATAVAMVNAFYRRGDEEYTPPDGGGETMGTAPAGAPTPEQPKPRRPFL